MLVGGALLWGLAVGVLLATGDQYVAGAVVMGTFVVPLSLWVRFAGGESLPGVDQQLMARLFAGGGLLGFLASALVEGPLTSQPAAVFDGSVGVIEEAAKLAVLAFMARHLAEKTTRSGFVLGGLVGLGFSAFESAGYALASALSSGGAGHALVESVLTRAAITPFTHGLWTAIAGAALFACSRNGRYRAAPLAVAALLGVAAVHACWDLMPNVATELSALLAGTPSARATGLGTTLLDDAGQAILSLPLLYVAYRLTPRRRPSIDRVPASALATVASAGPVDRHAA